MSFHGELLRYAQWHVLAIRAAEVLDVPVLRVHYEDYSKDLRGATGRFLGFLMLDDQSGGAMPRFDADKDYLEYFTREERAAASDLLRMAAGERGRALLEQYWVELVFGALAKQTGSIVV